MFIDGYGFFAACRKIACLVILLAFSSSAQAVFVSTPINFTFDSPREILTEAGQEHSYVVGRITITDGSTQTQWSLGKGEGELKYGVADFILSLERPDVTTVTMTPATIGQTVFYRYYLVKGPENVPPDKFDVIVQDGTKKTTLTLTVGVYNNPPRVYDSEGEELTVSTSPTSVGTYTATFVVGEVSTIVFSANEERLSEKSRATAPYFTWSIIPNVDSLATVYFANTDGSQFTASPQNTIPGSDVGVVYRSSRDENVSNAGYTLVVRDTLGRAATVTVLLTPKPPVIRHEGSSVEDGELDVSVEELARSFDLSAEYACPSLTPKCLYWSSDSLVVSTTPSPTAGGDTVRVITPEGLVNTSFPVKVEALDATGNLSVEATVIVTVVADMPPEIVSIDGQSTRRTFSVSPNLDTVRFSVVAEDDFDPESMIWAIFSVASSGKGTSSFVMMDGMMESTATTAKGSNVMVDFKKSTVSSTFRLTVTDSTGLVDTVTVTVNPGSLPSVTVLEIGLDDSETNIEVTEAEVASRLVLTFRAADSGLGETAALKWSVSTINGLVFDSTNSVIMGSEAELVFRFSPSTSFTTGRFQVQVSNSYDVSYSRTINLVGAKPVGKPPVVTYRVGDASSNFRESGRTISFPGGVMTAAISFRAYDPNPAGLLPDPVPVDSSDGVVIVIRTDTTFTWTIGEQRGLRVFLVGTNKGENVVVRFEEPPVEGSYFVIRVTLNGRANIIRVTAAKATQQLRIRTFLGGAVR